MRRNPRDLFWLVFRLVVGSIFIYASLYKIGSPGAFAHQIYNFKILPSWAINPLALTLPWVQLFCGVALLVNRGALGAGFLLTAMMLVFQLAIASALIRGLNISCGCFDAGGDPATGWTLLRDCGILAAVGVQLWRSIKSHASV